MRVFIKPLLIVLIGILTVNVAVGQEHKIQKSSEKIIVAGKSYFLHIVRKGETVYSISKAYNVPAMLILSCNNKPNYNLKTGEHLRIPVDIKDTDRNIYYCLKQGETLFSIYRKTGVKVRHLLKANPELKDIKDIPVGTYIRIPKRRIKNDEFIPNITEERKQLNEHLKKKNLTIKSQKSNLSKVSFSDEQKKEPIEKTQQTEPTKETIPAYELEKADKTGEYHSEASYNLEDAPIIKKDITIAVFLPFYLDMNDTINKKAEEIITAKYTAAVPEKKIYNKSETFIKFYQGLIVALDSLKSNGYNIIVNTYDTNKDVNRIDSILQTNDFSSTNIIIGPPYAATFQTAAKFAQEHNIPIITPLSDKVESVKHNPYVIQLNTPQNIIYKKTADYIYSRYKNSNIVVIESKDFEVSKEKAIITRLEDKLFSDKEYMMSDSIHYQRISFHHYDFFGIKHLLKKDSILNTIVVPCEEQTEINEILPTLRALAKEYRIDLIGLPGWRRFTTMDPTCFFELNTKYLIPYHINYDRPEVIAFVDKFRSMFYCEPDDFSFRAYDLTLYFVNAIGKKASYNDLCNNLSKYYLQSHYDFTKINETGGIINIGLFGVKYNYSDYNITYELIEK